jgi:hypothetical protein
MKKTAAAAVVAAHLPMQQQQQFVLRTGTTTAANLAAYSCFFWCAGVACKWLPSSAAAAATVYGVWLNVWRWCNRCYSICGSSSSNAVCHSELGMSSSGVECCCLGHNSRSNYGCCTFGFVSECVFLCAGSSSQVVPVRQLLACLGVCVSVCGWLRLVFLGPNEGFSGG